MTRASENATAHALRVGVDLDNTIVCYDRLFPQLALDKGLVPASAASSKHSVREHLRAIGREDDWTRLQGEVYGPAMRGAVTFDGVHAFVEQCVAAGWSVFIISHRTPRPYAGPPYDLHASALDWLREHELMGGESGLPGECVFLESTLEAKLARIAELRCTHFIDDLPELLTESRFPAETRRILFDPRGDHRDRTDLERAATWSDVVRLCAEGCRAV